MMTPGIGDEITPFDKKEKSKLETMASKLNSPSAFVGEKPRKKFESHTYNTQSDWDDPNIDEMLSEIPVKKRRLSFFPILVTVAFLFFIGAATYGGFKFWNGGQFISNNEVDITVIGPVSIGGGEELALDIIVQNNNQIALETVDLVIEYPDGTKQVTDLRTDLPRLREGLGSIEPNSVIKRTHVAALFGEEGVSKQIKIRVEYRLQGSNAIFEREKQFDVILQSSPIRLVVDAVKEITPNQELTLEVSLTSNSNQTLNNILLDVDYPFGFIFETAELETASGNNIWFFESLKPKETKKFTITGRLQGQHSEERIFKFSAGIADDINKNELGITFTTLPKSITISQPFFALSLSIDGDSSSTVIGEGKRSMEAKLGYENNTNTVIRDAEIVLNLTGDVLEESSIRVSEGFYRSSDNTITWNKTTSSEFDGIAPGAYGELIFNFSSKPLVSQSAIFQNPEIVISALAKGLRISEDNVPEKIESTVFRKIKFLSGIVFSSGTSYQAGPFVNTGPIPPRVDIPTTYTVTLSVQNSSNLVKNGLVTASLPSYVDWTNFTSPNNETISFDPISRIIEWKLGDIKSSAGYIDPARTVSFQVKFLPSISQFSSSPILVRNIVFTGFDTFTERNVNASASESTIRIQEFDTNTSGSVVE